MKRVMKGQKLIYMERREEAVKDKYMETLRVKQGIYTICFVLFCLIDQLIGSAAGRIQQTAANCSGIVIAVIILTGYHWKDFVRLPYLLWTICSVIGGRIAIIWGHQNYAYHGKWDTAVINVILYGYLVIRILMRIFAEKKIPRMNWPAFGIWVVMMLGMIFSKNESVWPVWFLVMFGCFYLTEYTREELDVLFNGMLNGIIIGFCILQGFATMYRAFDQLRYAGMYANGNMYALFCVMVHAAILGKWYRFHKNGAAPIWKLLAGAGSSILMVYCFLTIGRTALLVIGLNTVLLIVLFFFQEKKKRVLKAAGRLAAVFLAAIMMFPVIFFSVRSIPAEFYSIMTLATDSGNKIQGWVPIWDERYIERDEFLEAALGRLFWFFHPKEENKEEENTEAPDLVGRLGSFFAPSLKVYAAEEIPEGDIMPAEVLTGKKPWGSGLDESDPVLTDVEEIVDPIKVRWAIYRTYLKRLNFWGHRTNEEGVWVTESYYAPHAHNFFIQFMFSFGILTGILFLGIVLAALLHCLKRCFVKWQGDWFFIVGVFMITSFVGFGTLEINWRLGQLSFTALFVVLYLLLHRCEETDIAPGKNRQP